MLNVIIVLGSDSYYGIRTINGNSGTNLVLTTHTGFVMTRVSTPASAAATRCIVGPKGVFVLSPWIHVFIEL